MTTDTHISALVQEAIVRKLITPADGDALFQQMKWENQYALHVRYGDPLPWPEWQMVPTRGRTIAEAPLDPVVVLKNIDCWSYQCAEYQGYDETTAAILMSGLRDLIMVELGRGEHDVYQLPGYHDACWGIDVWSDVVKITQVVLP